METIDLYGLKIYRTRLPDDVLGSFDDVWDMHPAHFNRIWMYEKEVYIPRWQQAYGQDYYFSQQTSKALPINGLLNPYLEWCQENIDERMNGLLLNWYDSEQGHYIGAHRDAHDDLYYGSPIITISLGATRAFRMRPWREKGFSDIEVDNGSVLVIPWETNLKLTHEVPKLKKYPGKRISITARAFK